MFGRIAHVYSRIEPFVALIGAGVGVYSLFVAVYADFAGVDPHLLTAALRRLSDVEYLVPILLLALGVGVGCFVAWDCRRISLRPGLIFTILFCVTALLFRGYVFDTIGPKVKVTLFAQISRAACAGDYQRAIGLVEQIAESKRLAQFRGDASNYIEYLKALDALKRYRQTGSREARPGFELAEDQILFGLRLSRDYRAEYYASTPGAGQLIRCNDAKP